MSEKKADDGLPDLSRVSLEKLLKVDGPGFTSALDRIVAPQDDGGYYGFNSSI
jgi:FXSXX-COOH protein